MALITGSRKTIDQWNDKILDTKKVFISETRMKFFMELNIHGSTHNYVSVVTQYRNLNQKINRKDFDIQIRVIVQNFGRFNNMMKHFAINLVVTNNMSTYEK